MQREQEMNMSRLRCWKDNCIRAYARAEVDFARMGGTFPNAEMRREFESMFGASKPNSRAGEIQRA